MKTIPNQDEVALKSWRMRRRAVSAFEIAIMMICVSALAITARTQTSRAGTTVSRQPFDLLGIKAGMNFPEVEQVVNARLMPDGWEGVISEEPFRNGCSNYNYKGHGNNESGTTKGWTAAGIAECRLIRRSKLYRGYEHLIFYFVEDRLAQFSWSFNHAKFDEISEALVKKYANNSKLVKTQTTVANRMGAVLPSAIFLWTNGISTVALSEYGSTLDSSNVVVTHDKYAAEFKRRKPSTTPEL